MDTFNCSDIVLFEKSTNKKIHNIFCVINTDFSELLLKKSQCLHAEELKYFESLSYQARKQSYLLGRYSAKLAIIKLHSNLLPVDIFIDNGIFDFPFINQPHIANTHVSISHSGNLGAAIAYSQSHPMAIDIEQVSGERNEAIISQLSQHEINLVRDMFVDPSYGLTLIWTAKESLSKALKCGMLIDFKFLEIDHILHEDDRYMITYKNFTQYNGFAFQIGSTFCTIVFPSKMEISFDCSSIQQYGY